MQELKATIISAYRVAFPAEFTLSNRDEAIERIRTFLNNIPLMKEINERDWEKVIDNGVYAALVNSSIINFSNCTFPISFKTTLIQFSSANEEARMISGLPDS